MRWDLRFKIKGTIISALMLFFVDALFGKGAEGHRGPIGALEPEVIINEVNIGWTSDTAPGGIYNPRLGLPTKIGFGIWAGLYASGFDTNRLNVEITTPKDIAISGKVYLSFPESYHWGTDTILSSGYFQWGKTIPPGRNTAGVGFIFSAQEGEFQVATKIRIKGTKWKIKYGERPDKNKEGYYEGGWTAGAISDPKEREKAMGPWRVELLDANYIYEIHKKWKIKVEKDSAMLFDVTNEKSPQLVERVYSPYFNWLMGITPSSYKWGIGERSRYALSLVEEARKPAIWAQVLDSLELGAVQRLDEAFQKFQFALVPKDSIEYWNLTHQLAEEWDKGLLDYLSGRLFLTPYRDTFFENIIPRLRKLEEKRWKRLEEKMKINWMGKTSTQIVKPSPAELAEKLRADSLRQVRIKERIDKGLLNPIEPKYEIKHLRTMSSKSYDQGDGLITTFLDRRKMLIFVGDSPAIFQL